MPFSWKKKIVLKSKKSPQGRYTGHRPCVELLETRTVPSFFTSPTFTVGTTPVAQAVGDLNGDGRADLAVVNQSSNTVSVLLGNGDGTFGPKTDFATGASPSGVAVGDFNGDGKLDIAVANSGSNSISILLGNGDGTFGAKTDIALGLTPVTLIVGDFNNDGNADLAVATHNATTAGMTLLLGSGNGTFQPPVTTVTATVTLPPSTTYTGGAISIQSGDFNGDGRADLVVVNNLDTFTRIGVRFVTEFSTFNTGTASVLLGNGDGTFQASHDFGTGTSPESVAVGDFNGDGRPDFAVSNLMSNSVSVFSNSGGGGFSATTIALPNNTHSGSLAGTVTAGDFNGDGVIDLAVTLGSNGTPEFNSVQVYNGQTGGSLQAGRRYAQFLGNPVVGDFNGDGHPDLAGIVNGLQVWLNNGNGTFQAPYLIADTGLTMASQATADFNGDGIPDLITASTGQVSLGLGDGRFGDTTNLAFPTGLFQAAGGNTVADVDVDGNGTADIVVGDQAFPLGQAVAWLNSPGYDNRTGGAVGFIVSAPAQIMAGANASVTVTAVDALGNPVSGFLGTVDLDDTPAGSTALNLAGQYTFTAADNGRHTFLFSNLTQAGAGKLSVFAVGMPTATAPLTVVPAALNKFVFSAPTSLPAGTPFSFTISLEDKFGNVETGYAGAVHFSALANDTGALLPADYTFTAADAGTHTFTATLFKTTGASAPFINARDIASGVNTFASINVTPLAPVGLSLTSLPSPDTAGSLIGVTVTAVDMFGNHASGYTGTIHVSSSDAQASLPPDYTFTTTDGGTHSFLVTLKTAGTQSFGVADTVNGAFAATQPSIVVTPAAASVFVFAGLPSVAVAGTPQSFTITAMDAFGNRAQYFGTVIFSSSDGQAVLPRPYGFTAADAGSHTFSATLATAGGQSLMVGDAFNAVPTGAQSITVSPASAASFTVTGFPATTAGVAHSFTVTAHDAFGNVAAGYTGTVAFTSSDPIASLPGNFTFTAADAGVHTFTAALKRAGAQFIQVTDSLASTIVGAENGIAVSAAAVSQFAINGPTSVTKGVGFKFTVTAEDAFGNVNTGYRGTVHLSSTDATGGTQNFTFGNNDNGVHVFSYTLNALNFQTLTIVDTTNSSIFGDIVLDVLAQTGGGGGGGAL